MSAASPFVAGYTAAIRAELGVGDGVQFTPEALEAIRRDCGQWQAMFPGCQTVEHGEQFWRDRQAGLRRSSYPPLTIALGDDGKVRLTETPSKRASS